MPDHYVLLGHRYYSAGQLLARGWSKETVSRGLPRPTKILKTACGDLKLFSAELVLEQEAFCLPVAKQLQAHWSRVAARACAQLETHGARVEYLTAVLAAQKGNQK